MVYNRLGYIHIIRKIAEPNYRPASTLAVRNSFGLATIIICNFKKSFADLKILFRKSILKEAVNAAFLFPLRMSCLVYL